MHISRRDFLRLASAAAVALGLTPLDLLKVEQALAGDGGPPVIWLQGAVCTGCTISLLNTAAPEIDDVLTQTISLEYHQNLTTLSGDLAIASLTRSVDDHTGEFILCVEGGVPTSINGNYAIIGEKDGRPWTMLDALNELGPKARYLVAVGTCASFGGIVKPSQYTGIRSVADLMTGKTRNPVINIPACPVNPVVLVGTIVELITMGMPVLDHHGRPARHYDSSVHHICPRLPTPMVDQIGIFGCYEHVGCKGPHTEFSCPRLKWNNGVNWCIDKANSVCIGCASPDFPSSPFYAKGDTMCNKPTSPPNETTCCAACTSCSGSCTDCSGNCADAGTCPDCPKTTACSDCANLSVCSNCPNFMNCSDCTATGGTTTAPATA